MSTIESRPGLNRWDPTAYDSLRDIRTLVDASAAAFGDKLFLEPSETGIPPISFKDLKRFVDGFEAFMSARGVRPGDRCAVLCSHASAMTLQFIATIAADRVFVPINPGSSPGDIDFIVSDSGATALIYEQVLAEKAAILYGRCELIEMSDPVAFIERLLELGEDAGSAGSRPGPGSLAELVYTSGSTGRPKGVQLTHRNLLTDMFGVGSIFSFVEENRFLTVTPLFHNSGQIMTTLIPLYCGGSTTAVRPDMGFINFWHYVDRFQPEWTLVMPSHVALMLDRPEAPSSRTLRGVLCGGAKLERSVQEEFEKRFSCPIYANYGLTESTSIATCVRPDDPDRASGSVGRPLPINEVRVFKSNKEAAVKEVGEIWIRGNNVFAGYLNRPELYAQKVQFGWLRTGDLGYADERGDLHIVDRIDNMVIVGGENVYPSEIERIVPELPGVSEALVVGVPDRIMGRELVMVYRTATGAEADIKGWKAFLYSKLARFKVPRRFLSVKELGVADFPRSQSGKLLRRELQQLVENVAAGGSPQAKAKDQASPHYAKIAEAMATAFEMEVAEIRPDMTIEQVPSWDSLNHVKLVLELEEAFGIVLGSARIAEMTSVRAIVAAVESALR